MEQFNQGIAGPSVAAPVSAFEHPAEVALMEAHLRAQMGGEYAAAVQREGDRWKLVTRGIQRSVGPSAAAT